MPGGKLPLCNSHTCSLTRDPNLLGAGPLIPRWMVEVRQLGEDDRLAILWHLECRMRDGHISTALYDLWMAENTGAYQLGSNDELLTLWATRLEGVGIASAAWEEDQLEKGIKTRWRNKDGKDARGDLASQRLALTTGSHPALTIRPCGGKGRHVVLHPNRVTRREHVKVLNQLFPWLEYEDKQKTNLDLASLVYQACKMGHCVVVQEALALCPVGQLNTVACALVIAACGNPSWATIRKLMQGDRACCLTTDGFKTYFKAVSTAARRTSRLPNGEQLTVQQVSELAYFELSTGRAANQTDWAAEVSKRCGAVLTLRNPYTGTDFLRELYTPLKGIVERILPHRDRWGTWESFVKDRQKWAPSGSAAGARAVVNGETVRINKHSYFEQTPTDDVLKWMDSVPGLVARGSEKMEAGKARAIFGTEPRDQTIITYLIRPLEPGMGTIPEFINGHYGVHEVADIARKLALVRDGDIECTMLDYADFNYQHTLDAQELLFAVLEEALVRYENKDLNKAAAWARAAQRNQMFQVPNDPKWHRVTQGMFSGVRSTDFTNTILNLAYFEAASKMVADHTGLRPVGLTNIHKGDDVWISNSSRLWGAELYNSMGRAGFVFQGSKQMFDKGRGEFLRVLYTKDGARGYPMRAVATLLIKPIQSVQDLAPQNKATSLTSQINLLFRRGITVEACSILWWACVPHALKMRKPGGGGVSIPVGVAMKPFALGGLDLGPPLTIGQGNVPSQPLPAPTPHTTELEEAIGRHMSHDWIIQVSKRVKTRFDAEALEHSLHVANVTDSLRPEDRTKTMRNLEHELTKWRESLKERVGQADGSRTELLPTTVEPGSVLALAKRMVWVIDCFATNGEGNAVIPPIIGTINHAITQSPFRDISSAQRALKMSVLDSARHCLQLAGGTKSARLASAWVEHIADKLGVEVATSIIRGLRGVGISYEAYLHPIVLSMISQLGTDCAILSATGGTIRNQYEWARWLDAWMHELVWAMCQETGALAWSHY